MNTARGGIIDEKALQRRSQAASSRAPVSMCSTTSRRRRQSALRMPNTIVSAHMAGVTAESMDRMAIATVKNILSVLDGTPNKENAVNKEVFG